MVGRGEVIQSLLRRVGSRVAASVITAERRVRSRPVALFDGAPSGLPKEHETTDLPPTLLPAAARLILRLVHSQLPTSHLVTVEVLNGARRIQPRHLDETKAAQPSGLTIGHQGHRIDRSVLGKQCANSIFGGAERQVSYVDLTHRLSLCGRECADRSAPTRLSTRRATLRRLHGFGNASV